MNEHRKLNLKLPSLEGEGPSARGRLTISEYIYSEFSSHFAVCRAVVVQIYENYYCCTGGALQLELSRSWCFPSRLSPPTIQHTEDSPFSPPPLRHFAFLHGTPQIPTAFASVIPTPLAVVLFDSSVSISLPSEPPLKTAQKQIKEKTLVSDYTHRNW